MTTVGNTTTDASKKIAAALDTLTARDNVNKLWKDTVEDASWLMTITGLRYVVYLWKKNDEVEKDKVVDLFNNKMKNLVTALSNRGLTDAEAIAAGVRPVQHTTDGQLQLDVEARTKADIAEKDFYDVFKERCKQLNIASTDSESHIKFALAAGEGLKRVALTMKDVKNPACLGKKIESTSLSFNGRICGDIVTAYASLDVEGLTPEKHEEKAQEIKGFFKQNSIESIRDTLRTAVATDANKTKMLALATDYSTVGHQRITDLEAQMRPEFEATELALRTKIEELCGANMGANQDGSISKAWKAMNDADKAKNDAFADFQTARAVALDPKDQSVWVKINLASVTLPEAAVKAHADFVAKNAAFEAAKTEFDKQVVEKDKLVAWVGGNPTGGEYGAVAQKLLSIPAVASARAVVLAKFFNELSV